MDQKLNFFSQLLARIKNESPTLFKRLQLVFFSLAGVILVLIFLKPLHLNLHGFEDYVNFNTFLVLLGFAGINMLPVSNPEVLKKKVNDDGGDGNGDGFSDPDKPKPPKP